MKLTQNKKRTNVKSLKQELSDAVSRWQRLEYMIEIMQPVVDAAIAYASASVENKPIIKREELLRIAAHECAIKLSALNQGDYSI